jgi:hypothetical protein
VLSKQTDATNMMTYLSAIENEERLNQNPPGFFSPPLEIWLDQMVCQADGRPSWT